jgi:SAM-dependent methyltransferase
VADVAGVADYSLALSERELARYRLMADLARSQEAGLWDAAGIVPGARVVDVGCGPGAVLAELAAIVGDGGEAVGVDGDPHAVAVASGVLARRGLRPARAVVGRADAPGLEPGTFDVAVVRHVLAHNGGAEQRIVDHVATLARPGGRVYLVDVDGTATRTLPPHPDADDLARRYVAFHAARGNDIGIGLRIGQLLERAGLVVEDVQVVCTLMRPPAGVRPPAFAAMDAMVAEGHATADDVARWHAAFAAMDAGEPPHMFVPLFAATAGRA